MYHEIKGEMFQNSALPFYYCLKTLIDINQKKRTVALMIKKIVNREENKDKKK